MTPQLMQAIKLLQLSNLDLVAYVDAELERNPLLDRSAEDGPAAEAQRRVIAGRSASRDGEGWNANGASRTAAPSRNALEPAVEDVFPDDAEPTGLRAADGPAGYSEWAGVGAGGRDDGEYNLEAFVPAETTLADWLREQLTLAIADPVRRMIGQYLIDLVDEAGYLSGDSTRWRKSSAPASRKSRPCSASCRALIRQESARAISPNAWRCSSRNATASIRRCRP